MHAITKSGTFRMRGPEKILFDSDEPENCEIRLLLFTGTSVFKFSNFAFIMICFKQNIKVFSMFYIFDHETHT